MVERTAQSYGPGITAASKAVLLELVTTLGAYRDALVLVGGWVPYFLLAQHRRAGDPFVHVGSIDIDLVVDPVRVQEPQYASIVELLRARGFRPATDRRGTLIPTSLVRTVPSPITDKPYAIRVDFLLPLDGSATGARLAPLQDTLMARKVKGCEAALRYQTRIALSGTLPEGGTITVPLAMADLVASLTMKGIVLGERYREKDAYDLYALIGHCGPGPQDAASRVRPHLGDSLVAEGMQGIRAAFATRAAHGPSWVAAFCLQAPLERERERLLTDAFMVVREFLDRLGQPALHPAR
jgi:hypothetical protein